MLKKLTQNWDDSFSNDPLSTFLQGIKDSIDHDEIRDEAIRQLHRLTQLEEQRKQGVIDNNNYLQKQNEISNSANEILKKISNHYLPILPITAIAGSDPGPQYAIEYEQIEEWKYIKKGNIRHRIGIRVEGDSMQPAYQDGDILVCVKENLANITERQPIVVVAKDNSVFLKKIKKVGNKLEMISLNAEFKTFQISIKEVEEFWKVESKIK
jgi:phage repressor protein C with HTH and peptisase S24 domain